MKSEWIASAAIFIFLGAVVALNSCADPAVIHKSNVSHNKVRVAQTTVQYVDDNIPFPRRLEVEEAIRIKLEKFHSYFGRPSRTLDIYIHNRNTIVCNEGHNVYGYTRGGEIHMIIGRHNDAPPFFHELCHSNGVSKQYSNDSKHKDPEWLVWNAIDYSIGQKLKAAREK